MAKLHHPPPVSELARVPLQWWACRPGMTLWRVYRRGGRHPGTWNAYRYFGPLDSGRFDPHAPDAQGNPVEQGRGVLYAANGISTCLAEACQRTRAIHRRRGSPWMVGFRLARTPELLDVNSLWPISTGFGSATLGTCARSMAREWARAIYEAYPEAHGIAYRSSMTGRYCIALFERALTAGVMPASPSFHRALADSLWGDKLFLVAKRLRYGLK